MSQNYVSLKELVLDWSHQSGELPQVFLNNICDQEARGRVPRGTFRQSGTGGWGDPGSLSELVNKVRSSGYEIVRQGAADTLSVLVVSKSGVLSFCELTSTRPPRCVAGFLKWLFWRKTRHSAPPPYPFTPEEIASEREATERERAAREAEHQNQRADTIKSLLSDLETQLERFEEWTRDGQENWSFWLEIWDSKRTFIEHDIGELTDGKEAADFSSRLQELVSKYASIKAQAQGAAEVASEGELAVADDETYTRVTPTIRAETEARRYLKEQVRLGSWRPKSDHFEKARVICGDGLSRRAFERAWRDVAPDDWRAQGRRPARHERTE